MNERIGPVNGRRRRFTAPPPPLPAEEPRDDAVPPGLEALAAESRAGRLAERLVDRQQRIETAAYLRAERRGFEPGHELEDWLAAEAEVGDEAVSPALFHGNVPNR